MEALKRLLEWGGTRKDIALLAVSGAALAASLAGLRLPADIDPAWVAIFACGAPIILEAVYGMVTAFDITADVLVSIALVASIAIGETFAAGEVAFIMQLGGFLEELTVARARAGIESLVRLTPTSARVLAEDGSESIIDASEVKVGDVLRVLPGETVPADGAIRSGQTSIDQSVMTGESLPVDKGPGDEVQSGTVNQFGSFDMVAERVGEDSSIQRMVRLVQSADAGKAKVVRLADRWAVWIVVIALAAAVLCYLITHEAVRSVTILVVFCPCSLVLATPTAIMAAIGNATNHGFLVREGDALERLATVERVALDKTGTLTHGAPEVVAVVPLAEDIDEGRLLELAAAAEARSEHPLGRAIAQCCTLRAGRSAKAPSPEDFEMLPGRGVWARVDGSEVAAGNLALLAERGVTERSDAVAAAQSWLNQGCTITYVAVDGRLAGLVALADTPREGAREAVASVEAAGATCVLLTGDHEQAAAHIAAELGISRHQASCLPEDKLTWIEESEAEGHPVCMVGDGINDAPALKRARVGIAMGGVGSDIAVDAADIALVNDDVSELGHLLALSRHMMRTIKSNLAFSMTLNFVAIALAIAGVLDPVTGALVHNAGSVLVIVNSALLLGWKQRS